MPEPTVKIPAWIAGDLFNATDGTSRSELDGTFWQRLGDQLVAKGRQYEHRWLVVTNGGGSFGVRYQDGLADGCPTNRPWENCKPDEELLLTPLVGVPVTSTTYLTEREYGQHLARAGGSDA